MNERAPVDVSEIDDALMTRHGDVVGEIGAALDHHLWFKVVVKPEFIAVKVDHFDGVMIRNQHVFVWFCVDSKMEQEVECIPLVMTIILT